MLSPCRASKDLVIVGTLLVALVFLAITSPARAQGGQALQAGDILSLSVVSIASLNKQLPISPEGQVNLPLIGWIDVGGLTVQEVEQKARDAFAKTAFRQRIDGDEIAMSIHPEEVSIEVSSYRPVYVTGSVTAPGVQIFQPGLTVRQAVAMAGGLRLVSTQRSIEREQSLADLQAQHDAAMASYVAAMTDLVRLGALVDGAVDVAEVAVGDVSLPPMTVEAVLSDARRALSAERDLVEGETAYLQRAILQNGQRIAVLREQQGLEQAAVDDDQSEYDRVFVLANQGALQQTRLVDAGRQLLLSSTRALETKAELATAEARQADLIHQMNSAGQVRAVDVLADLGTAKRDMERYKAEVIGLSAQLKLALAAEVPGDGALQTSFTVYGPDGKQVSGAEPDLGRALGPGDTVEMFQTTVSPVPVATTPSQINSGN